MLTCEIPFGLSNHQIPLDRVLQFSIYDPCGEAEGAYVRFLGPQETPRGD